MSAGACRLSLVILAAGLGTRLNQSSPKPLTQLFDGRSILHSQRDALAAAFPSSVLHVVVGFKKELIMEAAPEALFIYNPKYSDTNTSKSLLRALRLVPDGGVLWINGDVVFDPQLLDLLDPHIDADRSVVCVNRAAVGEEEVKYRADDAGYITQLSKVVNDAAGEAVGINYLSSRDRAALIRHLAACHAHDYFERGIETAIAAGDMAVRAVDISGRVAVEIDTEADLSMANAALSTGLLASCAAKQ